MNSASDSNRRIRVGIIGVGQIGKHHIANYRKLDHVEIIAIADINRAEADRVAQSNDIANVYNDFRLLLERDDIEAVDVCLHNNFHMPVTVAALEAGKHVFCEKPMAGSYVDAQRMLTVAQNTGQQFSIQIANLFHDETRAARELIQSGHLGRLYYARSTGFRRRGRPFVDGYGSPTFVQKQNSAGGALYDMGVYHISTILYLLDNPDVLRISGKTYQQVAMNPERESASGYNVEELGLGFVRLADEITLEIAEAWAINLDAFEGSYVVGSDGGVRLEPFGYFQNIGDLEMAASANLSRFRYRQRNVHGQSDIYDSPQAHWIAALQGRVALLPTAEIALNTMLISEGIYLSNQLGREVSTEEVQEASVSSAIAL